MPEATQANGGQTPQGDDGAPKYVTEEQLNKAISSRFTSFEKKLEKSNTDAQASFKTFLDESFAAFKTQLTTPPPPDGGDKTKQPDPFVQGLQKQIADLNAKADKAEAEKQQERAKARDMRLRSMLTDELVKGGLDADRARRAVAFLVDSDKRVSWDEEGESLIFKHPDDNTDVDLSTGLKRWLDTDDGKFYQPPRGTQGSGDRGGGRKPPGKAPAAPTTADIGMAILQMVPDLPYVPG